MGSYSDIISVFLLAFLSFFAVLTPTNYIVAFLSLTTHYSHKNKLKIANRSMLIAFITILVAMFLGEKIFNFLQIDLYAFKIAGGTLLAISGTNMIFGQNVENPSNEQMSSVKDDIAIFPLSMPILAGPGAISTGIIFFTDYHDFTSRGTILAAMLVNFIILYITVHLSSLIASKLNATVLNILYRFSGLLISALAINILLSGIRDSGLFG
ncbi:MarC family protein [Rickettsiales bacterium LUAb2]